MGYMWILVGSQYTILSLYFKQMPSPEVQSSPKLLLMLSCVLGRCHLHCSGQGVTSLVINKHTIYIKTRWGRPCSYKTLHTLAPQLFPKKKVSQRRNVKHYTSHVICDTWWGVNILLNFSPLAFTVWEILCFEDIFTKDQ